MDPRDYPVEKLYQQVCELMGLSKITPVIKRQISRFILEEGMTPLEIARCLVWYVDVEQGELKPQYGIAVVLNIREASAKWWKEQEKLKKRQEVEAQKIVAYQDNNIIFNIENYPHKKRIPKQIDLNSINFDEEE